MEGLKRDSFVFYGDWYKLKDLIPDHYHKLLDAIMDYAFLGVETKDPDILAAFALVKIAIDKSTDKYENICKKRKEAIQKRWEKTKGTKAYNCIQTDTKDTNEYNPLHNDNVNDNVNDNDNDNDNDKGNTFLTKTIPFISSSSLLVRERSADADAEYLKDLLSDEIFWENTAMSVNASLAGWGIQDLKDLLSTKFYPQILATRQYSHDYQHFRNRTFGWLKTQADYAIKDRSKKEQLNKGPLDDYIREHMR